MAVLIIFPVILQTDIKIWYHHHPHFLHIFLIHISHQVVTVLGQQNSRNFSRTFKYLFQAYWHDILLYYVRQFWHHIKIIIFTSQVTVIMNNQNSRTFKTLWHQIQKLLRCSLVFKNFPEPVKGEHFLSRICGHRVLQLLQVRLVWMSNNNNNNLTCKAPVYAKKTSVALADITSRWG